MTWTRHYRHLIAKSFKQRLMVDSNLFNLAARRKAIKRFRQKLSAQLNGIGSSISRLKAYKRSIDGLKRENADLRKNLNSVLQATWNFNGKEDLHGMCDMPGETSLILRTRDKDQMQMAEAMGSNCYEAPLESIEERQKQRLDQFLLLRITSPAHPLGQQLLRPSAPR